jgi:ribosome-associated translation inhibitor RaiA
MLLPGEVKFRHMPSSETIEASVREHAAKLDRFHPHLTSCRVMIEALHAGHHDGTAFHVRIDVTVPDHELVATSESPPQRSHEDVHVAVREAFDAIRRELQHDAQLRRGDVKAHEPRAEAPAGKG